MWYFVRTIRTVNRFDAFPVKIDVSIPDNTKCVCVLFGLVNEIFQNFKMSGIVTFCPNSFV